MKVFKDLWMKERYDEYKEIKYIAVRERRISTKIE